MSLVAPVVAVAPLEEMQVMEMKLVLLGTSGAPDTSTVKVPCPSTRVEPIGMLLGLGQGRVAVGQRAQLHVMVLPAVPGANHVLVPVTTQRLEAAR